MIENLLVKSQVYIGVKRDIGAGNLGLKCMVIYVNTVELGYNDHGFNKFTVIANKLYPLILA